ncbi:hypothetical protein J5J86_15180 [Aquabacter sp. L1I39]|uniref:hypothetical protein n=1 Tax=Aquabacter sp. L1I39 TaxID=2820278 RepID=UPI001ADB27B7|nr:hypothetical protein [Aquabacter sp. L1I39]QTL02141.1 hypothetical protein J5J86_15180 [Aquabacter sp. L1I39]
MDDRHTAYPDDLRQNLEDQHNPPLLQHEALRGDFDHALHNQGGGSTGEVGGDRPAEVRDSPLARRDGCDVIAAPDAPQAHWDAPLPVRIRIASAENLEIRTLRDAGNLVSGRYFTLSHSAALQECADLLVLAARTGDPDDVSFAAMRLQMFLRMLELA